MALSINLPPYRLNNITGTDTFLVHYDAADETGAELQISEFFPQYMVSRSAEGEVNASERFLNEFSLTTERFKKSCAAIQGLNDAAFNPIVNVVEYNGTCYMVRGKCALPALATYMSGHRMDFYEGYLFIRPLLLFLSQAARSEVYFNFSLEHMHVNRYGQLILDKPFSMDTDFNTTILDLMKIYYFLTVGKVYDPASPSPKEHGVNLPQKLDAMMGGVLSGDGRYGGVDDFSKAFRSLVDREGGGKEESAEDEKKSGSVLKWVAIGLSAVFVIALTLLIIFVLIPGYRKAVPDLEDPSLITTPAPAPEVDGTYNFSALAPTNPSDGSDILDGAFLKAGGELFYRSYKNNGFSLARRGADGRENIFWADSRPAFLVEDGGYIYFSDGLIGNKILQVGIENGDGKIISDNCALYLCINGGYIYYTNHNDRDRMYRKNISTGDEEIFVRAASYETVTDGNKIYFINGDENFNIYSVTAGEGGTVIEKLNDEISRNLCYVNGTLFYTVPDGSIRAVTAGGLPVEINCGVKAKTLEAEGSWLVMTEENTNRLKAHNLDTNITQSVGGTDEAAYAAVYGGEIFAADYYDGVTVRNYTLP